MPHQITSSLSHELLSLILIKPDVFYPKNDTTINAPYFWEVAVHFSTTWYPIRYKCSNCYTHTVSRIPWLQSTRAEIESEVQAFMPLEQTLVAFSLAIIFYFHSPIWPLGTQRDLEFFPSNFWPMPPGNMSFTNLINSYPLSSSLIKNAQKAIADNWSLLQYNGVLGRIPKEVFLCQGPPISI